MKREEKEVRTTVFNKITITKEEQKFLAELVNAITDLCDENEEAWNESWSTEYDIIKELAEAGSYEIDD